MRPTCYQRLRVFSIRIAIEPAPAGLSPALARYMMLDPYGGNLEQAVLCVAPRGASPLHDDRRRRSDPEKVAAVKKTSGRQNPLYCDK
jgi:hypothetical protein